MNVPIQCIPLTASETRLHILQWMADKLPIAAVAYTSKLLRLTVSYGFIAHVDDDIQIRGLSGGIDVVIPISNTVCALATEDTASQLRELHGIEVPAGAQFMSVSGCDDLTILLVAGSAAKVGQGVTSPDGQENAAGPSRGFAIAGNSNPDSQPVIDSRM